MMGAAGYAQQPVFSLTANRVFANRLTAARCFANRLFADRFFASRSFASRSFANRLTANRFFAGSSPAAPQNGFSLSTPVFFLCLLDDSSFLS